MRREVWCPNGHDPTRGRHLAPLLADGRIMPHWRFNRLCDPYGVGEDKAPARPRPTRGQRIKRGLAWFYVSVITLLTSPLILALWFFLFWTFLFSKSRAPYMDVAGFCCGLVGGPAFLAALDHLNQDESWAP